MNPLLLASASTLARMIREREVTSVEVVEAHISRMERVNPRLNALVRDRFGDARAEARRADDAVARGEPLPPLHGVPCTIKECFAFTGMPNSSGLVARRDVIAQSDAPAVARLRAAGAIPLGVTNVSELCMWMESDNRVYGRSRNPYDPRRTVGGSSGGEGAVIGAGASPFGLGSDVGGSIRMPAFFNGVFGHKPSPGIVPSTGQYPAAHGKAWSYVTTGPLCRRAEDLLPLLRVMAGHDDTDESFRDGVTELRDPALVDIASLRVFDTAGLTLIPPSRDLRDAQKRAARALELRGATVREAHFPELSRAVEIWSSMLTSAGGATFAELLGDGVEINRLREALRYLTGRSPYTLPSLGLAILEKLAKSSPTQLAFFVEAGLALKAQLESLLGTDGVLLFPSHTRPAPRHGTPLLPPIQWIYTGIFNVLEFAVTQVPLGLDARGLPLGIQVAAPRGQDHLTLAVAIELERSFGGWVPPASMGA